MLPQICFFASIVFSIIAWGIVTVLYIWPALHRLPRQEALRRLLILHCFRFIGLAFLVPGVVSPGLPAAFAIPSAYGDIVSATLAMISLAVLQRKPGLVLVWVFNVWGTADLLNAFFQGSHAGLLAGQLGAAFFIPTFVVPLLLITHGLVFWLLLQREGAALCRESRHAA